MLSAHYARINILHEEFPQELKTLKLIFFVNAIFLSIFESIYYQKIGNSIM